MPQRQKEKKIFYQLWTRKEAILKAMGKGISFPMDQFDVSLINEQDFSPVGIHGENRPLSKLYVQDIELDEGYFAAIAYESCGMNISFWNYIH
jgi:4'-phosphopantetheinyl transferase